MKSNVQNIQGEYLNVSRAAHELGVAEDTVRYFIDWGVPNYIDWEDPNAEKKEENCKLYASQIYTGEKGEFQIRKRDLDIFLKRLKKIFKEKERVSLGNTNNLSRKWWSIE